MKKFISILVSAAMLAGAVPSVGIAADDGSRLDTYANQNLTSSNNESLIDDTYQYCAYGDAYYAYLWVPQTAQHINGVMIAKSNLIEARLMQSKTVRDTLAKYNIGIVYLHSRNTVNKPNETTDMGDFNYTSDANMGAELDEIMARLAAVSGFEELRYTPFVGVGHSAGMGLGRAIASWDPSRVIAQICLKGGTNLSDPGRSGDSYDIQPGVPTYIEAGQFTEHAGKDDPAGKDDYIDNDYKNLKKIRENGADRLVSMSIEWEAGHYDWSEKSNEMLAQYLDAVIPARLGEQAQSQDKLGEDYMLVDLSGTGYVSELKMFGSRTSEYAEGEYKHGDTAEFSESELKEMVWFPTEAVYNASRNFTNDRKDLPITEPEVTENPDASKTVFAAVETQFDSKSGVVKSGNYVRYDNSMLFAFDTAKLASEHPIDEVSLSFTVYHGNTSRKFKISQYNQAQDGDIIAVPDADNSVVINTSAAGGRNVSADVTAAIKSAVETGAEQVYFAVEVTDEEKAKYEAAVADGSISGGYPGGYSGSDIYLSTTDGVSDETMVQRPQLILRYEGDSVEPTATPVVTKHQYLQLEDPSSKTPKEFTRITRYDTVNPNDSSYADGLINDPMTFSMYVDKMNVISPDHIGGGEKLTSVSDTPAVLTPAMAPVEWVGVEKVELTDADIENNVASKWRNVLRWKNNRVYYRAAFQDSYLNLNTFDVYNENGELDFAYATNTFQISPIYVSGGSEQHITMSDIEDVNKDFSPFTINPESSAGLEVDVMVDYGPITAVRNADGSYTIAKDQIPAGAVYPIECKLVLSQFGVNNNGTKINTAEPVEKVFYITDDTAITSLPINGEINPNLLKANKITGFNVEGSGTIMLNMNAETAFNNERAAAISAERANSADAEYAKHYQYPSGYNPYDYWDAYPNAWTAQTDGGFVPLTAFTNDSGEMINLDFLNEIKTEGITSITPVTAQTELAAAAVHSWGNGANIVWQSKTGDAYDGVKLYLKNGEGFEPIENVSYGANNAVINGLENGEYTFKITTVKDGIESQGIEISGTVDASLYAVEDFETDSLNAVLSGQINQPVYEGMSQTAAALSLNTDDKGNHYLGMQNSYTSAVQTVNINIPGGLTAAMTSLDVDIMVDKLENTYSSGQVYFEFFNPATGKSYGTEKGDDFALEDKEWHKDYSIPLSSFGLPSDEETLSQITVLKIGRKVVGGGNNNRRGKIYLDNISFEAAEPIKTKKLKLSYANVCKDNDKLPNGFVPDEAKVNYLFDGDTSNTNLYTASKQRRLYMDLGRAYEITKIVVTDYTTKGTLMVSGGISDPAALAAHDDGFKTMIRTNGSTQNGVASTYEEIKDQSGNVIGRTAVANDVYMADSFKTVRYISLFDWSNAPDVAELEIYVVDDGSEPDEICFGEPEKTQNGIKLPVRVTGSPESIDAVIYVAEYSDGKLIAVRAVKNETISKTKDIELECTISENCTAKLFVWGKDQKPITGPFTIE